MQASTNIVYNISYLFVGRIPIFSQQHQPMRHFKFILLSFFIISFMPTGYSQNSSKKSSNSFSSTYVKTYVTKTGKVVKGHVRKKVSTDPNAAKNRTRSNVYYHTKGKYKRKK